MCKDKRSTLGMLFFISAVVLFTGCNGYTDTDMYRVSDEESQQVEIETKDEEQSDYYVVECKNETNKSITLKAVNTGQEEIYSYSGITEIKNKYDESLTMAQVSAGEVVTIEYERDEDKNFKLTQIKLPKEIWTYDKVSDMNIDEKKQMITIGKETYQYGDNLLVSSNEEAIELVDINDLDILSVKGTDKYIYSITVNQGHGYIRLKNDDAYIGGWIDVGGKVIQVITERMLLVVPEGTQQLTVTNAGRSATTSLTIKRDEELAVDIKSLKESTAEIGKINFKITPKDAVLTINGKKTDYSKVVSLEYGSYPITVKADGYDTLSKTLVVQSSYASIELELEKTEKTEKTEESTSTNSNTSTTNSTNNSTSGNSSSSTDSNSSTNSNTNSSTNSNSESNTNSSNSSKSGSKDNTTSTSEESGETTYKIYIQGPEDAEVYFDGVYKGIIPVMMEKTTGSHTISIRKSGYTTKSYTVTITEDAEDVNFVFPSLVKESN